MVIFLLGEFGINFAKATLIEKFENLGIWEFGNLEITMDVV
jgi:hypothetical protein